MALGQRQFLYNLIEDKSQAKDVSKDHPDVLQAMSAHYDQWYAKRQNRSTTLPGGSMSGTDNQNPMMLYAQDWEGDYCDNRGGPNKERGRCLEY